MKMAPTSANMQPVRIVWVKSPEAKAKLAECVMEGNKAKVLAAPVTAVIGYDIDFHEELPWLFPHTDAKSWFEGDETAREAGAFRNSSLQGAYLMLAARALGLDCGPMSGFDQAAVNAAFFADEPRHRVNFLCSVGYGDPASIFDRSPRPEFARFNRIA
jgi:3-hydroxypropanoate dehydrogenase